MLSHLLSGESRMLTAQALVAPIISNTAPRSQVIKDRIIAVTTRSICVSLEVRVHSLKSDVRKALRDDLPRDVVNIRWRLGL